MDVHSDQDFDVYRCSKCWTQKLVALDFDLVSRNFYPVSIKDAICPKCEIEMDRL
jgi:hypothetical protein